MIKIDDIENLSPSVDKNISKEAQDIFTPDEKRSESEKKTFALG